MTMVLYCIAEGHISGHILTRYVLYRVHSRIGYLGNISVVHGYMYTVGIVRQSGWKQW